MRVANRHDYHLVGDETEMYVGRPTPLGNPFVIGVDGTRAEVIEKYRTWILHELDWGNEEIERKGPRAGLTKKESDAIRAAKAMRNEARPRTPVIC